MWATEYTLLIMVGYCRICKIGVGEEIDVSFHRLPKDEKTKKIWFAFIGRELGPNSGICSKHFKQSDFIYKIYGHGVRRFLKQGAYPSILHVSNIRENVELSGNINNCISSRTERDTDPEKNIIIKEELQECIIIDETVINTENSMDIQFKSETDDPLIIMEHNTNLETSTILGNERQEFINIDETINTNLTEIQLKREIDPLAITKHDTDLETNIILGNRIQESINIDEPINTNSINQLKRKLSNSLVTRKRFYNTRYTGDLCQEDFTSDEAWYLFKNYLTNTRTKIKSLNHKIIYLNNKINRLQKINHFLKIERM
ncbi:THAP domain-containing protein 9 [Trachymyrmex cornetzi]|uniref:THAP domain-containing protein 9 n=1 Tax=Trachymyrmex cornetzi TaxID=471704 RepID=A0A151JMH2_9HYME|nr:THAP domain-containing protein 9 [Trachymyrmex cornetzi]